MAGAQQELAAGRADSAISLCGSMVAAPLIFYILGDNGASPEGWLTGTFNESRYYNGFPETAEEILPRIDEFGGPTSYINYPVGWALAMDTPMQWTKQVASHFGGTRDGLVVHWPAGFPGRGEVGTGRVSRTAFFGGGLTIGANPGTPVTRDYARGGEYPYTGQINSVAITTEPDVAEPSRQQVLDAEAAVQ